MSDCCHPKPKCPPPLSALALKKVAGFNSSDCPAALDPSTVGAILTQGTYGAIWATPCVEYTVIDTVVSLLGVDELNCKHRLATGDIGQVVGINGDGDVEFVTQTFTNLGTGEEVYAGGSANNRDFKTLVEGANVTITSNAEEVTISADTGSSNTFSSLGAGEAVYAGTVVDDVQFKSLVEGANIVITSDADTVTISAAGSSADLLTKSIVYVDTRYGDDLTGTLDYANRPFQTFFQAGVVGFDFGEPVQMLFINSYFTQPIAGWNQIFPSESTTRTYLFEGVGDSGLICENFEIYTCPAQPVKFKNLTFLGGENIPSLVVIPKDNVTYSQNEVNFTFEHCTFDSRASGVAISWHRDAGGAPDQTYAPTTLTFIDCDFKMASGTDPLALVTLNNTLGLNHGPSVAGNSGNTKTTITFISCRVSSSSRLDTFNPACPLYLVQNSIGAAGTCSNVDINLMTQMQAQWQGTGFLGTAGAVITGSANLIVTDALPF